MRRHTCLPRRGASLCQECGTNVNTDHVDFSREEKNLVYMDKVYTFDSATSCPLLSGFVSNAGNSVTEVKLEGDTRRRDCSCGGRGCDSCRFNGCVLDENAVFTIDRSHVLVESFSLANPTCLSTEQITVDGVFVDTLDFSNGHFTATTNDLLPQVLKERCQDLTLPTKAFFLITDAGPWVFRATFVLEGTVNTNGRTCCFQVKVKTSDCGKRSVSGLSNFAIPNISLPCAINGTAPVINFQFTGGVSMLNPELSVICGGGGCCVVLETNLVVEPTLNVEVVRRTLFCVDACEGMLPCDGTEQLFETLAAEDCEWPPAPPCRCGTAPTPMEDPALRDRRPRCNFDDDDEFDDCDRRNDRILPISDDAGCGTGFNNSLFAQSRFNGCNGCSW